MRLQDGRWRYGLVSAAILLLDQTTKAWIASHPELEYDPIVVVPGFFKIVCWRNPGALFSLFTTAPDPWRYVFLTALPIVAILVIGYLMNRVDVTDRFSLAGFSLVLGGAIGNLLDRLFRGTVVDFLRFGIDHEPLRGWLEGLFGSSWWPAFNVADSAICVGAVALAVEVVRSIFPSRNESSPETS